MNASILKKYSGLVILVLILGNFIFSAPAAQAVCPFTISHCVLGLQEIILKIVADGLGAAAQTLEWFLRFQGIFLEDVTMVEQSWQIFRDFANMFFILILIIIAFATIFDYQQYNWKALMAKFLIAALLINFSLAIGEFLINVATTLSTVALNQFEQITSSLANGMGLNKLVTSTQAVAEKTMDLDKAILSTIITSVFVIIFMAIVLLSFLSALIFSIARIPVLWALLIVSPIAWIASVLPNTRHLFSKWWSWFIGWTFFLPVYLFMLVLGIVVLTNRPDLEAAKELSGASGLEYVASILGFGFQDIFFYVLVLLLLVGGLIASLKFSFLSGTKVTETFGAINNWAQRRFYVEAAKKAGKEKLAEIQEKGLPGKWGMLYGGKRADVLREAKMRELLGTEKDAAARAKRAQFNEDTKKAYEEYEKQNLDQSGITLLMNQRHKLTDAQFLALAKMRAENGWIPRGQTGKNEIEEAVKILGESTKEGQEYIRTLVKNDFTDAFGSVTEMENFVRTTTSAALKKAGIESMAKNNSILSEEFVTMGLELFATETKERQDTIEKELQKNIKNLEKTKTKTKRASALLDTTLDPRIRKLLAQQMSEDDEINTYQKYITASGLFGGEREAKSRVMLGKIIKDKPLAFADINFRRQLGVAEPNTLDADYNPLSAANITPSRRNMFAVEVLKQLPKMSARAIAETDVDIWTRPVFEEILENEVIRKMEDEEPTVPARGNRREKPGKGKRYALRILKALEFSPDPEKEQVMSRIMRQVFPTSPHRPISPP